MFDLIVIGGGPAGYMAAERAGQAGMSVLLIEKNTLGGVCLNEGCVPSKTLLNSAKIFSYAVNGEKYGVRTAEASLDQKAVIDRKNKVVRTLVAGIKSQLKESKVTVVSGHGEIMGRDGNVVSVKVGEDAYQSHNLLIATGSQAIIPRIPGITEGIEAGYVLTNREILNLTEIPQSLVVVGGGVIGLEMADYYNTAGSVVTVIEMLDKIAGPTDREISDILKKNLEKRGINFKLSCKVTSIGKGYVEYEEDGGNLRIEASHVLMSIGRKPVVDGFGLDSIGVLVEGGKIVTDNHGLTNIPGVYAAGDVNGMWMLAHAAYREAEVAVNSIIGKKDNMRYDAMPSVIYTTPEIGSVGETEDSCTVKGIKFIKTSISMNYSGRYVAENERGDGICKIIVDPATHRLIGCHIVGSYASEIIVTAGMLIEMQMRLEDIKEFVFPHPTVCEIIREAVFHTKI